MQAGRDAFGLPFGSVVGPPELHLREVVTEAAFHQLPRGAVQCDARPGEDGIDACTG